MKKNFFLFLFVIVLLGACSKQKSDDVVTTPVASSQLKSASSTMVILHQANLLSDLGSDTYKAVGFIKVKNVAYQKQVTVRYRIDQGPWVDVNASYYAPLDNGYEVWQFQTGSATYNRYDFPTIEFAVRYIVNGVEYWDNNGGANYEMQGSIGSQYSPNFLLGGETMVFANILLEGSDTYGYNLAVFAYVQNVAYQKTVTLVYTTDNWQTVKTADIPYSAVNPGQPGVEIWANYNIPLPGFVKGSTVVQAAVDYHVNGQDYWDNNFTQNYTLQ